ncbi:hypothetical protein MHBO_000127 [Bonamia ostreae]|uniref:Cyclin H n=1 Tax=Bonamia ostreae TaxID=126728 RepID=A0ABV2AEG4_9EUKA
MADALAFGTQTNWILEKIDLAKLRERKQKEKLEKVLDKTKEEKVIFPTVKEISILLKAYEEQLWALCEHLNLPLIVKLNAITYFKRFYLRNSAIGTDIEMNLVTALTVANKTGEYWLSLDKIASTVSKSKTEILKNEIPFLEGIKYNLLVHHPHSSLEILLSKSRKNMENMDAFTEKAINFLTCCYKSDIIFLYKPTCLAVAAFFCSAKKVSVGLMDKCKKIVEDLAGKSQFEELVKASNQIIEYFENENVADIKNLKRIRKKLSKINKNF